jgi:hypothetical protein
MSGTNQLELFPDLHEGKKNDQGKPRTELLPYDALLAVSEVLTSGAAKYDDRNWEKGMAWSRLFGALLRHLFAWGLGSRKDDETGKSHLAHAACGVLMLLTYEIRGSGADDMPH